MEGLILLLAGLVLAIPVIAIVALVRSGKVRQLLEESNTEHRREVDVLRAEVASFRRELFQLNERVSQQGAFAHPAQTAADPLATTAAAIKTPVPKPVASEPHSQVILQRTPLPTQPPSAPRPIAAEPIPPPPVVARATTGPSETPIPSPSFFEIGSWQQQKQLRMQGFGLLIAAFIRIFFVNLTANALPGEVLSPRVYTIVPMALIYFYVWTRLRPDTGSKLKGWSAADLIAYFGTGCVAALLYFEVAPEWIIVAWSVLALTLILAALLLDRSVFLQQSILLVAGIVARSFAHNIFGASYFTSGGWRGKFSALSITAALLLSALPLAFRLHARYKVRSVMSFDRYLGLQYPEQVFFFAPMLLISVMIAVKMNPGMVTLSWGMEGVAVILLGLLVTQRSYRLTGLFLLLLCVGKIVVHDAWLLGERDRYTTFIVLGAALTLVSTLYGKYRETVRKLL